MASYVPAVEANGLLHISGQISFAEDGSLIKAGWARTWTSTPGQAAARRCGIMLLAQMKAALGSLDRVERVVKLGVFVNSRGDFTDQPKVANGASELMQEVFGEAGPPCPLGGRRAGAAARRRGRGGCDRRRSAKADPARSGTGGLRASRAASRRRAFREQPGRLRRGARAGAGIECDLQADGDDQVLVFHDADAWRMCGQRCDRPIDAGRARAGCASATGRSRRWQACWRWSAAGCRCCSR